LASWKRRLTQIAAALTSNAYFKGFMEGDIYRGSLKNVCVPGLNCYSCPGAIGSCPIGSLQAVAGSLSFGFSFYIVGFLTLVGIIMGRLVCGWLCPFGFIQELLHKIPLPKVSMGRVGGWLKYLKYAVLIVFVLILPALVVNEAGLGEPAFCKYICPAGTLEGGVPLLLLNESLREAAGYLFAWKLSLALFVVVASMIIFRPFCRFLCPLGAVYALFNRVSIYRLEVDEDKCVQCGTCQKTCQLEVKVYEKPNDPECIRCGECIKACPNRAISSGFFAIKNEASNDMADQP